MPDKPLGCAITGASGYVGSRIAMYLMAQGANILELSRRPHSSPFGASRVPFQLGDDLRPQAIAGADVLIHCAYDFTVSSWADITRVNVDGTAKLLAGAATAQVPTTIIISTLSAFPGCKSLYGKAKLLIEQEAAKYGAYIIRPGLVYDNDAPQGMVGALARLIDRSPLVPLVGAGRQILYPCYADDLARLVMVLATRRPPVSQPILAACHDGLTFRQTLRALAVAKGRRVAFVPVPYPPILLALRVAEAIGVRTRLRSDSLVSLVNQDPHVDFSGLEATDMTFRGFDLLSAASDR
jgi:nucleoside-diphosphate-sugar epimerase